MTPKLPETYYFGEMSDEEITRYAKLTAIAITPAFANGKDAPVFQENYYRWLRTDVTERRDQWQAVLRVLNAVASC